MKRSNLRIVVEEKEESQLKGPENIFNKIIEEKFPNLKKEMPRKVAFRIPKRLNQKEKPP